MNAKNSFYNSVICRYNEIALKGNNRWKYEQYLISRISQKLAGADFIVSKTWGRILVRNRNRSFFTEEQLIFLKESLPCIFGMDSFSFSRELENSSEVIRANSIELFQNIFSNLFAETGRDDFSFRIRVKRTNKTVFESKKGLEILIASELLKKYPKLTVNLKEAEISLYIEVHKEFSFLYDSIIQGAKGLPSGTNPPVLSLLSGGFDSPVATYMTMKRGVYADFLSFHSYPFTPLETNRKIINIAAQLNKYQVPRKLFLCNFLEVQKEICLNVYENLRTIHYRRVMFRLAEKIALLNGNMALVTGESLGQVASQTLINLANIESAIEMIVLRPLIGMDKNDTMDIARKIGTYDLSAEQLPDSCTLFAPSNPSTAASRKAILKGESLMNIDELLNIAFSNTVMIDMKKGIELPLKEVFKVQ